MCGFLDRRSQRGSASSDKAGRVRLCRSGIFSLQERLKGKAAV